MEQTTKPKGTSHHPPVIDAWIQHPTPSFLSNPVFASLLRWTGTDPDNIPAIPLDMTVAAMDMAGVTKACLSAWWGPGGPMLSNDDVASHVQAHPDRFIGAASVDLHHPMDAVRELRRCVNELGFKALRVLPWLWRLPPNDRRYYPLYAACIDLGIPFCLQVGHTGPMMPSEPGRPIPYLDDVALEFPELTIVAGHIGYPWTQEMIALATKYPNVYIDTSAYKPKRYPPELVDYIQKNGRKKVLFGSNYPMIMPADCIAQMVHLDLDDETQQLFLHDNAARVFNL
jgi:predicted TIM-barrel fold metal-dependent hydrolase